MSLLDTPTTPTPDRVARKVTRLLGTPIQTFNQLFTSWSNGVSDVWDDPSTASVLAGLGTSGGEIFALSAKTAAFLESLKPGCTVPVVAKIGAFVVGADGTVSLPPAAPVPTAAP